MPPWEILNPSAEVVCTSNYHQADITSRRTLIRSLGRLASNQQLFMLEAGVPIKSLRTGARLVVSLMLVLV